MYAVMELCRCSAWCHVLFQSRGQSLRERDTRRDAIKILKNCISDFFFSALGKKVNCMPLACPPVLPLNVLADLVIMHFATATGSVLIAALHRHLHFKHLPPFREN